MLVFIDTNIFLDLYRMGSGQGALRQLELLSQVKDHVITTYQVEMEYKKHRQQMIIDTHNQLRGVSSDHKQFSPLLLDSQPVKMIKRNIKAIETQQKRIKERMDRILLNPANNDPIYQHLQRMFKAKSTLNLNRDKEVRHTIRRQAKKRFFLGYPPRKPDDNSIGDAVNWEWIVKCAIQEKTDVTIVSRDNDFGISHNKKRYINDWLKQEFKERVGRKDVILTDKMMDALAQLKVRVSSKDREEENALVESGD
ncbi:PIN domain-containing protein [Sulfitobacter sp. SK011]|uniref:PIN domain-containing protein n=1 Tax=Sulfitobacter sp. SK011 TaxID=1389004 RepID=UPI000E0AE911|nr:PIN domain-containing protein [Sulfitobacter sp. SK011]AXI43137.1 hypothetical protein C1J02_15240 [Sulfitobacter sp. SK011]